MNWENIRNKNLHWEGLKLMYQDILLTELIPSKVYKNHYHLKFHWRDEPTPELFNIFNARENARTYSLQHCPESLRQPRGEV